MQNEIIWDQTGFRFTRHESEVVGWDCHLKLLSTAETKFSKFLSKFIADGFKMNKYNSFSYGIFDKQNIVRFSLCLGFLLRKIYLLNWFWILSCNEWHFFWIAKHLMKLVNFSCWKHARMHNSTQGQKTVVDLRFPSGDANPIIWQTLSHKLHKNKKNDGPGGGASLTPPRSPTG